MSMPGRAAVLYVDDERANLDLFRRCYDETFRVLTAGSGPEALAMLDREEVGVLVSDQRMAPMTGIELLAEVGRRWSHITRVLLTAYSDRDLILAAIHRGGVHDYVLKPWEEDLEIRLRKAFDAYERVASLERAQRECEVLRAELDRGSRVVLIGSDGGLAGLTAMLARVARTDSTVMIRGESGTGKELVARELHRRSHRAAGPFVRTNCAALAEGVLESELFGHEAGAFTGASKARIGRFEQAHGGTLFLDEIGDISPALQVRLLRVLQERELERVGGNRTIHVDIRVVCATHRPLEQLVRHGRFREDLFHRLHVVPLQVPPLRERRGDIIPLASQFVREFADDMGKRLTLGDAALDRLTGYDWPGNVRELRNVIERAAVLADPDDVLDAADLMFDFWTGSPEQPETAKPSVFEEIAEQEAERVRAALREAHGSKAKAARLLGIPRTTLNDRIRKLDL